MKTHMVYMTDEHKTAEMVPADVAQGLYDALDAMMNDGCIMHDEWVPSQVAIGAAVDALAAADGEDA